MASSNNSEESNEEEKNEFEEVNKTPDISACLKDIKECKYSTNNDEIDQLYNDYI
jgi:hypothetical protein